MNIAKNYKYVAYIDESGDDGLTKVRPIDPDGGSEWLLLTAVIVQEENEAKTVDWVKDIQAGLGRRQRPDLHFSDLSPDKKFTACSTMAQYPLRIIVIASNKKNMKGHINPHAAKVPSRNWFYCWMTRLLLERVTHFVKTDSLQRFGKVEKVKVEYSERGGHSYSQMEAYYFFLRDKPLFLPYGEVHWDVLLPRFLEVHQHGLRAGLQLADIASGAFFKACDIFSTGGIDITYAKQLLPRLAHHKGQVSGYGLKLMPSTVRKAALLPEQEKIFLLAGYPKSWWAPASIDSEAFSSASSGQASWEVLRD